MKKYLLILSALFFISSTYAQKTISFEEADSLSKAGEFVIVKVDSNGVIYYQIPVYTVDTIYTEKPMVERYDTVLVMMLMVDTAEYSGTTLNGNGIVFWRIGYEVLKDNWHFKYLDYDKFILPKNIIVWQSKQY